MKIVFVAPRYHTNQHGWTKALQDSGHEVYFLVGAANPDTENREALTPEVVPQKPLPRWLCRCIDTLAKMTGRLARDDFHSLPSHTWLVQRFKEIQPSVVIVRHSTYPLSIITFLAANRLKLKTILYNQDPLNAPYNWRTRLLQWLGIVPHHRITPLRRSKKTNHHAPTNSYYVPLIVDTDFDINTRTYCPDGVVHFLFVGKFNVPRKQHRLMLEAFAGTAKGAPATLTMTGYLTEDAEPFFESLQKLSHKLGIDEQVIFKPNLSHPEMLAEYIKHDVFVLPSTDEPFSISTLEAMSAGLPIIITDTNGTRWAVPEESIKIVKPKNLESLVQAIDYFLCDRKVCMAGMNNFLEINQNYDSDTFKNDLGRALDLVL